MLLGPKLSRRPQYSLAVHGINLDDGDQPVVGQDLGFQSSCRESKGPEGDLPEGEYHCTLHP